MALDRIRRLFGHNIAAYGFRTFSFGGYKAAQSYSLTLADNNSFHRSAIKRKQKAHRNNWVGSFSYRAWLKTTVAIALFVMSLLCERESRSQELPSTPGTQISSFPLQEHQIDLALGAADASVLITSTLPVHAAVYSVPHPADKSRTADGKFFLLNGIHLGMAVTDVELTQHCIANHKCHEANPLMPSSQAGQLSVVVGYAAVGAITSYWLKKHKSSHWWLPPAGGIAGHTAGIITGISH